MSKQVLTEKDMSEPLPNLNYFTEKEYDSPDYRWVDPKQKRIKFFVFSTLGFHGKGKEGPDFDKVMVSNSSGATEDVDVRKIKEAFRMFITDDDIFTNMTIPKFAQKLDDMRSDVNLATYDCFFFVFLTFSVKSDVKEGDITYTEEQLHFADGSLSIHTIWDKVKTIEYFNGKPKVFLIQSDNLKLLFPELLPKGGPTTFVTRKIPIDADRLILQSAIPTRFAHELDLDKTNPSGSFLIQAFLEVMAESGSDMDLLSLTTDINCKVKMKIKQLEEKELNKICIEQVKRKIETLKERHMKLSDYLPLPMVSSTFTRFLYMPSVSPS